MSGRRLKEWRTHLRHCLAALLAMSGRGTGHGLTALHCFVRRCHAGAIHDIRCQRSPDECDQNCSSKTHFYSTLKRERHPSQVLGRDGISTGDREHDRSEIPPNAAGSFSPDGLYIRRFHRPSAALLGGFLRHGFGFRIPVNSLPLPVGARGHHASHGVRESMMHSRIRLLAAAHMAGSKSSGAQLLKGWRAMLEQPWSFKRASHGKGQRQKEQHPRCNSVQQRERRDRRH